MTLAFVTVIGMTALIMPASFFLFHRIQEASDRAAASSVTLQAVGEFQRSVADVRIAARDGALGTDTKRTDMIKSLNHATDMARCIAQPDKCEAAEFTGGERVPDAERVQWLSLLQASTDAETTFRSTMSRSNQDKAAIRAFDQTMEAKVDTPSKRLAQLVADRGRDARASITKTIATSMLMLIFVIGLSLFVAAILAAVIPRSLMSRLNHLRALSHRLSHGDLTARADASDAQRNDEIGDLIADFNLMAGSLQQREHENQTLQEQLHVALLKEQERATRDPLTGLRNHRYFQDSLRAEIERCRRGEGQVSIAVIDLDNFKTVNDRFGHSEGDSVLLRATKGIADNLRPYDLACRLGGEEFGIIFPEADPVEAKAVLDRIAEYILPLGPNGERLSFSGGITTFPMHANTQTDLYQRADEAAYSAKMAGKAQSLIYDPAKVTSMNSEDRIKQRSLDAMLTTATTLVSAVDQKDPYTRHHAELTAIYAATIARALRMDEPTVKLVYRAGLLHDVGKIGIADEILVKGDRLTHDEWVQVRMHPEFSYRILEAAEMEPVATWTRHHHEHYDGTGYPMQLAGDQIPLGSRIILVADAFEAMTSDRIYRRALGVTQAMHELQRGAGTQFDPQVVEAMLHLVSSGVFHPVMEQYGRTIEPVIDVPAEPREIAGELVGEDGTAEHREWPEQSPQEWTQAPADPVAAEPVQHAELAEYADPAAQLEAPAQGNPFQSDAAAPAEFSTDGDEQAA